MDPFGNPVTAEQTAIMSSLGLLVFQIGLLSALIKLAIDNLRDVIETKSWWPNATLGVCVVFTFVYGVDAIGIIMVKSPGTFLGMFPGVYLGYIITGMSIGGGAGKMKQYFQRALARKEEDREVDKQVKLNGNEG